MSTSMMKTLFACLGLVTLAACSAAPSPCLVARTGVGGFGVELVRQGPAPAGCTDLPITQFKAGVLQAPIPAKGSPQVWFDGWRTDLYKPGGTQTSPSQLNMHSDIMSFPADNSTVVQASWPDVPDAQNICTVTDVPAMTDAIDPLGIGGTETTLSYKINKIQFLDGTLYQGLQFTADVDVTFGTCTANYTASGMAPNVFEGFLNGNANNCETETDCDPNADLNANPPRSLGSGYNPLFKATCRTDLGAAFVNADGTGVCFAPAGATFPFIP